MERTINLSMEELNQVDLLLRLILRFKEPSNLTGLSKVDGLFFSDEELERLKSVHDKLK